MKHMPKFFLINILFLLTSSQLNANNINAFKSDSIEVYIIESFIPPEEPGKFKLSFYTSEACETKIVVEESNYSVISKKPSEFHSISVDISKIRFKEKYFKPFLILKNNIGEETIYQLIEVSLPQEINVESSGGILTCLLGSAFFLIPSYNHVLKHSENYSAFSKEIPLFSFYTRGYNYPVGYISAEYSYLPIYENKSFARIGYNQIFEIPVLEYVSPSVNAYTNFKGINGISTGISFGLFKISNVFTIYVKGRYNFQPTVTGNEFFEISLGLYSSFFSLNF